MEPDVSRVGAIAVEYGVITGLGDIESLAELISPETELLDLQGLTLLPRFIDSHVYVFEGAS